MPGVGKFTTIQINLGCLITRTTQIDFIFKKKKNPPPMMALLAGPGHLQLDLVQLAHLDSGRDKFDHPSRNEPAMARSAGWVANFGHGWLGTIGLLPDLTKAGWSD